MDKSPVINQTKAEFWNIPATKDYPKDLYVIQDEAGTRVLDDVGSHSITNPELLRLTSFRISLARMDCYNP